MNEEMIMETVENPNVEVMNEVEITEEPVDSGNGIIGKVVIGLIGVSALAVGVWYSTNGKREAKRVERAEKRKAKMIKKLEDEGYVVIGPDVTDEEGDTEESTRNDG